MPDREKVIKWLDVCKTSDRAVGLKEDYPCRECPYKDSPRCMRELVADALALLKEQEAKPLRCKECSYHRKDNWCNEHGREVSETDYCSFGSWEGVVEDA